MGQYDAFIWVGGALVAGWFIIQNPDIFGNIFGGGGGGDTPPDDGGGGGGDTGGGDDEEEGESGSSGSAECKKACSNCWCKTYSEQCGGSCSRCKGGNRVASKCGLDSNSGGGGEFGSGSSSSSSKSEDCKNFCNKGWCESYRKRGCTGGCAACSGMGGRTCPEKVVSSNCAGDCKTTCWRSRTGTKTDQVCVSKSISGCSSVSCSACQAARSAYLKKYSNLAYAYPAREFNFSNVYS